jgi:hypothetical protein
MKSYVFLIPKGMWKATNYPERILMFPSGWDLFIGLAEQSYMLGTYSAFVHVFLPA